MTGEVRARSRGLDERQPDRGELPLEVDVPGSHVDRGAGNGSAWTVACLARIRLANRSLRHGQCTFSSGWTDTSPRLFHRCLLSETWTAWGAPAVAPSAKNGARSRQTTSTPGRFGNHAAMLDASRSGSGPPADGFRHRPAPFRRPVLYVWRTHRHQPPAGTGLPVRTTRRAAATPRCDWWTPEGPCHPGAGPAGEDPGPQCRPHQDRPWPFRASSRSSVGAPAVTQSAGITESEPEPVLANKASGALKQVRCAADALGGAGRDGCGGAAVLAGLVAGGF